MCSIVVTANIEHFLFSALMKIDSTYLVLLALALPACANDDPSIEQSKAEPTAPSTTEAAVTQVTVAGEPLNYEFSVTIASPNTGCEQYADWWEVVSETGELIYRRVLLHSHVNEQPFTRSGGVVAVESDEVVWVRLHMNNVGYSPRAMRGSVMTGFIATETKENFAASLSQEEPLPTDCTF